jgi:NTP pyrophosphatase (non-canonical NTP hydrolase)
MLTLAKIIEEIKEYQEAMGYKYDIMTPDQRMQTLRNYSVALMMEQAELLDEVSWKPWRTFESQKPHPDMNNVAREWVDMLFFLVDQSFCLGLTYQDIEDAFMRVMVNNRSRILSGYSHVKTDKTSKKTTRRK